MIIPCLRTAAARLKHLFSVLHAWPGRYLIAGAILVALNGAFAHAADVSKDQRQWWIDHYGLIDAKSEPLVARAEQVFKRVAAAADKKGNWLPKLVVVGGKGDPYALAIRDGSVILTLEGLKICYSNAAPETGDSRLAFLIGHELSHLAKDDFWHSSAFAAVSSYKDNEQVRRTLMGQLEKTGGSLDFVRTQELQADSYGILYMTMAGYDPKVIIGQDNANFFQYWVSQIAGKLAYDDALHLSPEARSGFIRTELQPIIDALPRFWQGVQLYQSGNYEVAVTLFESFIEKYPAREAYNNLGVSHYQLAMQSLSECNKLLPTLNLPMALDSETTAQLLRQASVNASTAPVRNKVYQSNLQEAGRFFKEPDKNGNVGCFQNEAYKANLQDAIRFLEEAEKKDATYLPARINVSTALIVSENYAKAISAADEALEVDPNSREALNNKAVAEYLFNKKNPSASEQANKIVAPSDHIWAGVTIDMGNFSMGPSVMWWATEHFGAQASYGQGTFTSYSLRGLVKYGKIAGLTPYAGLGYLSVERETNVFGVDARFSGKGGEILAGVLLPISASLSLFSAINANTIKLEKIVSAKGQNVPVTMSYNPLSFTTTLLYVFD